MSATINRAHPSAVKYVSLHEPSGYGIAARRYLQALSRCGVPVTWTPLVPGWSWGLGYAPHRGTAVGDADLDPLCNRADAYDTVVVHSVPEYFPRWRAREPGKRLVGCTVWETDAIPRRWRDLLNTADALVVPCRWNAEVFRAGGVRVPIAVVPYLPDERESPERRDLPGVPPGSFAFYTVGEWVPRKGVAHTVRAFCAAFTAHDPVTLVVKTGRLEHQQSLRRPWRRSTRAALDELLRAHRDPPHVLLLDGTLDEHAMLALHARGDCFVSLTRGEGFGLGAFDAAWLGRPVVMTGYGGQLDFLPEDLAHLVRFDLVPCDGGWRWRSYTPDQRWAEPDVAHGAALLREVFAQRDRAAERGLALQKWIRAAFDARHTTHALLAALGRDAR